MGIVMKRLLLTMVLLSTAFSLVHITENQKKQ